MKFVSVKLIRFLNNANVIHIMAKTSWTPIAKSIDCLTLSSLFSLIKPLELTTKKTHKKKTTSWSISSNNISSSLEEEFQSLEHLMHEWNWKEDALRSTIHIYVKLPRARKLKMNNKLMSSRLLLLDFFSSLQGSDSRWIY